MRAYMFADRSGTLSLALQKRRSITDFRYYALDQWKWTEQLAKCNFAPPCAVKYNGNCKPRRPDHGKQEVLGGGGGYIKNKEMYVLGEYYNRSQWYKYFDVEKIFSDKEVDIFLKQLPLMKNNYLFDLEEKI